MKKFQHAKTVSKMVTAALAAAFVFMSATPAQAAEKTVSDLQDIIYQNQESDGITNNPNVKAVVADDGVVEYHCRVEDINMEGLQIISDPAEPGSLSRAAGVFYDFEWPVYPTVRHVTNEYKVYSGQAIQTAALVAPTSREYWLGIMDDDGHARYIIAKGSAAHNFKITTTNMYCVFVQNNHKDVTLNASGTFKYE